MELAHTINTVVHRILCQDHHSAHLFIETVIIEIVLKEHIG